MKYIALLRGVNVGGHRKVLMSELKVLLNKLGFLNVVTYIQSGNVLFETEEETTLIEEKITKGIYTNFGFEVPIIVISVEKFKKLLNENPYLENTAVEKIYITFLKTLPAEDSIIQLEQVNTKKDKFRIIEQMIFLAIEGKYHKSKLNNQFFEKKLKIPTTTRNWKTITKLLELCGK